VTEVTPLEPEHNDATCDDRDLRLSILSCHSGLRGQSRARIDRDVCEPIGQATVERAAGAVAA
jgi:hypothetical protein